jgi:hypothetical protein
MSFFVPIPAALIAKTPEWKEDAENPPISVREAMKLADALKDRLVKDGEHYQWKRESTSLVQWDGRWCWVVEYFQHYDVSLAGCPGNLRLVVLMDGTVIWPKITKTRR